MEKYFFEERLEEGILYVKSGILTAAVSGTEYNAVFPPGRAPKNIQRNKIPCLARRCSSAEGGCMVEAISADSMETEKKEWICMNPSLFKNAAGFFLESHAMAEIAGCCADFKKDQAIAATRIDFTASDGTMIDVKVSMEGMNTAYGRKQDRSCSILMPGMIMGYMNIMNIPKYAEKRMILLLIQQRQTGPGCPVPIMSRKTYESIKTGCTYGLELWNAVMQADTDGISLVSCRCITDDILSDSGLFYSLKK